MPDLTTGPLDQPTRAAVVALAGRIEAEDGSPPLSDQTLTRLGATDVDHVIARAGGAVVGYAQRDGDGAEVAAEPAAVAPLLDALARPGLLLWSHGRHSRLVPALTDRGFERVRELHQLRRPLDAVPDARPLPAGVNVRAFRPGADDAAWLAVNAAAFASHAEQGKWTQADLQARVDEPWFEAAGFLLAERNDELLGYHWTKMHPGNLGEVYVLGIAPAAQGLGLGATLLTLGLRHLAGRGCTEVELYVDGDNPAALRLYERAGFSSHDLDVQWRLPSA